MDMAVVIGASGGIGAACADWCAASGGYGAVIRLGRGSSPAVDLEDENSVASAAKYVGSRGTLRLLLIASGFLHSSEYQPEKSLRQIDPLHMAHAFAVNATGPALVLKHFAFLVPRDGNCIVAAISAKVGSIGDNQLGGWISYRASKAALNQIVRTAACELRRTRPGAICVAIHPGTVDTPLSAPFSKSGLSVRPPAVAATEIMTALTGLSPESSGCFFDYRGKLVQW